MKNILKNIFNLSKLYIIETNKSIEIFNKQINKKSIKYWKYILLFFMIYYLSSEILKYTIAIGNSEVFLNGFLLFIEILIIIKTFMVSIDIFFYSKDIENILHLPIKPFEIIIAKLNTILFMNYELELLIALVPIYIYQIHVYDNSPNILNLLFALFVFPIFSTLLISVLTIILINIFMKFSKKRELIQKFIVGIFIVILIICISKYFGSILLNQENFNNSSDIVVNNINNKIKECNKYFITIKPISEVLKVNDFFTKLLNYLIIFVINIIMFAVFIFSGNKIYLKRLLSTSPNDKRKKHKSLCINRECNKNSKNIACIKKEFLVLQKNPLQFIYSIYQMILMTIIILSLFMFIIPVFKDILQSDEFIEYRENMKFDFGTACLCIGTLQFAGLFNYLSITAFSREGKDAYIVKNLPISLYKIFIFKSIPQILFNTLSSIAILSVLYYQIPQIGIKYILIIFLLSSIITIINSFILCLIDLLRPNLDWNGEYAILKNNKSKLLQYILIIFNIIALKSVNNMFKGYKLDVSLYIFFVLLIVTFIIINIFIYKFKDKIFNKID